MGKSEFASCITAISKFRYSTANRKILRKSEFVDLGEYGAIVSASSKPATEIVSGESFPDPDLTQMHLFLPNAKSAEDQFHCLRRDNVTKNTSGSVP